MTMQHERKAGSAEDSAFIRLGAGVRDCLLGIPGWMRYQSTRPPTLVILGMHRSGTSFLARVINLCGASFGGDVIPANPSNRAGHWESNEGLAINDLILRLSGGAWDAPPSTLYCDKPLKWKMKRFLGSLHRDGTAVWKDPRTTLTFPLWRKLIADYHVLAMFRHPMSVAQSLLRRDGIAIDKGLELWRRYNETLLDICAAERDVAWIDFDLPPEHARKVLDQFLPRVNLKLSREAIDTYQPELRTSDAPQEMLPSRIVSVYERLQENCRAGRSAGLPS